MEQVGEFLSLLERELRLMFRRRAHWKASNGSFRSMKGTVVVKWIGPISGSGFRFEALSRLLVA